MTDYERGRLAGFAEGVDAAAGAAIAWADHYPRDVFSEDGRGTDATSARMARLTCANIAKEIRALRAPSPAEGAGPWFPPEVTAEDVAENRRWLGLPQQDADDAVDERIARSLAQPPKEDAPRCEACAEERMITRAGGSVYVNPTDTHTCVRGTGRSTTGGGR